MARSGALLLELSNAPTVVIKGAKKAHAEARTRVPDADFSNIRRLSCKIFTRSTLILEESCKSSTLILQRSYKSSTLILQESYKTDSYPARFLHIRRLISDGKILHIRLQDLARWCVTFKTPARFVQDLAR